MTPRIDPVDHLAPDTLNAFIDGELPAGEQQEAKQHLNDCHSCALQVLSATQLKAATAHAGHRFSPTAESLARLTQKLQSQRQTKKIGRIYPIRPTAWAALAAAILLVVSILGLRQIHRTNGLAAELLDQHLATLGSGTTPQVISTDRHTVKPWFQGRLPFSFNLPDAAALPPDTTLIGADLTYFNGQPAALLLFTIHKHQVSIFLTQRANGPVTVLRSTQAGFTIDSANTQDLCILAVSDVNPAELELLVASLVRAQSNS
ncbi:anti-sigma factor family protein [Acidicapsa acidisoli]|uniref:anti-sigma factor family protein n=1 Tax=Acidicapsa acidisoli TaxID=1615681 RepID=UPI0021E0460A|nr:zf-HC2 domain-containing protein [Acidicapsa acidisoli]